jgi:hypothetical protein
MAQPRALQYLEKKRAKPAKSGQRDPPKTGIKRIFKLSHCFLP